MLIFFEMAPPPQQPQNQVHPNDHLIPIAQPAGPSPVIKVPKLPGVEQPSMIRVERRPQEIPQQQPNNNQFDYGKIAKSTALIGGGIAAGALAHHFFGHNNDTNNEPVQNTPPPKPQTMNVSTQQQFHFPKPAVVQHVSYQQPVTPDNVAPSTVRVFRNAQPQPSLVPGKPRSLMVGNGSPFGRSGINSGIRW